MTTKLALAALLASTTAAAAVPAYINQIVLPGDAIDLAPGAGANQNRLSLGSDLVYDRASNTYFGLTDRGPGGGTIDYQPRIQRFAVDTAANGAISNYRLLETIRFTDTDGSPLTGLSPARDPLNGTTGSIGRSFDSEGIAIGPNGSFFVSDEYGPSVFQFDRTGRLLRRFETPGNLLPRVGGVVNFENDPTSGRQGNRGFEGLTITPDNRTLYAVLQDPLQEEGLGSNPGRRSRNVRIVRYDIATGESTGQFVYQLEPLASINAVAEPDFGATAQGRNIGLSSIFALNDSQFLLIERDNRGLGVEEANNTAAGIKSVYLVNLAGATDVSAISLAGSNDALPPGVTPVSKTLFLDILATFNGLGQRIVEKFESLALGPTLDLDGDGVEDDFSLLLATDNDYSVTQNGTGTQFDVCAPDGFPLNANPYTQVAIDSGCPAGTSLIPTFVYAFTVDGEYLSSLGVTYVPQQVPAPAALALFGLGALALGARRRR